jgi:hypothetical protein
MAVHDSRENLPDDFCSQLLREDSLIDDLVKELSTLAVFCDQVEVVLVLVILQKTHYVRVFLQSFKL